MRSIRIPLCARSLRLMAMLPDDARRADRAARRALGELPIADVLVVAPPGCGKTEALADRAAALVRQGQVTRPCRILAITFSNRSRDNLRDRVRKKLGPQREMAYVTNLHGLSSRLLRAHGQLIGIGDEWDWPQKGWRASLVHRVTAGDYRRRDALEADLRTAKMTGLDDDGVMDRLSELGSRDGHAFEVKRISEKRLDYQDLLRHAQRLLRNPEVLRVYRMHFAAVLLDEAQDLTQQQFDIVLALGEFRLTAAADQEQGIYSFTGADAASVLEALRSRRPVELRLHRSFRSAEAVLRCVNALSETGSTLTSATPERWRDEGIVAIRRSDTLKEEATYVAGIATEITGSDPEATVGVVSRSRFRRAALLRRFEEDDVPHVVWDRPTDNPTLGRLLRGLVAQIPADASEDTRLEALVALAASSIGPDDPELLDELTEAASALRDLLPELGLEAAVKRCNIDPDARPIPPGIHVLTGHEGKGQQFDWVVALGLEDGVLPDFRATTDAELAEERRLLRVIVSRACYGVVCTYVRGWPNRHGKWWSQHESPWLDDIESVVTHSDSEALSAATSRWRVQDSAGP